MKIMDILDLLMMPVNFRSAWDIKRACNPIWASPISPSISALGTRAATESTTITSMAPLRTRVSAISKACSPVSGCDEQLVGLHAELLGIDRVERMFRINKGGNAAGLLHFGDEVQRDGRFARASGPKISVTAPWNPAHPQGRIEGVAPVE